MACPSSLLQEISGGGRPWALQRRLTELPSLMSTSELVSSSLKLGGTEERGWPKRRKKINRKCFFY